MGRSGQKSPARDLEADEPNKIQGEQQNKAKTCNLPLKTRVFFLQFFFFYLFQTHTIIIDSTGHIYYFTSQHSYNMLGVLLVYKKDNRKKDEKRNKKIAIYIMGYGLGNNVM